MAGKTNLSSAAALLGRRGGKANTPAQQAARRRNTGRPKLYRLVHGELQRRDGDRWLTLEEPYDRAAREAVRRLRHRS